MQNRVGDKSQRHNQNHGSPVDMTNGHNRSTHNRKYGIVEQDDHIAQRAVFEEGVENREHTTRQANIEELGVLGE